MKHEDLTNKIIHAFFKVYNTLGYGFLERVYRNALYFELLEMGINANMEKRILVYYKTHVVGEYCADLMVEDAVICELKTSEALCEADENQLINYLRATNVEVGLLLNFGKKAEVRRKVYDNEKKLWRTRRTSEISKNTDSTEENDLHKY
jgi:GxxExxY protein